MPNTLARSSLLCVIVLSLVFFFAPGVARSQDTSSRPRISIIPQPRELTVTQELFPLDRASNIALADPRSADDQFAAADFVDDVMQTAGVPLKVRRNRGHHSILIGRLDLPAIQSALKNLKITLPVNLDDEGYVLAVGSDAVVVAGHTSTGVFYGLQTLKQLVRGDSTNAFIQGVHIIDWPAMRWRAVSDDISRGPVPTVDYIKRQLRTFAAFKLNMHSFYMEHTFASSEHPLIGPAGGSLTPVEIRVGSLRPRLSH